MTDRYGIVFDLDGTLLSTMAGIAGAMNMLLTDLDLPHHTNDQYNYFVGEGIDNLVIRALGSHHSAKHNIPYLVREYSEYYSRIWRETSHPYRNIPELLDSLEELNIPKSILSNKSHSFVEEMVSELLGKWKFEIVMGKTSNFPLKPDPAAALHIAKQMKINPHKSFFIGDSMTDIRTARNSGMKSIGVDWGYRLRKELEANNADYIVSSPLEIIKIVSPED